VAPPSPKPPVPPGPKPATPRADDGPRWLSRPVRGLPAQRADAPPPAAGSPPAAPGGLESTNRAPEALPAQLRVAAWGTNALIAGVALLASCAVVAALFLAARAPTNAERAETATRLLNALPKSSATPSVAPRETPSAAPSVPVPTAVPIVPIPPEAPTPTPTASTPPAPAAGEGEGTISTPPDAAGHRVFVDGRYAGVSPGPIKVRCGQHVVKVGSGGTPRAVDVPCGGDALVPTR
jgi:hypothetical protein